jgi:hypothetical protein
MVKTTLEKLVADRLVAIRIEIIELAASNKGTPAARRKKCLELFDEMEAAKRMLANADKPSMGDFSEYAAPVDAIVAYLKRRREPTTEVEIIDSILEGGYRGGRESYRYNLDKAIKNLLTGTGAKGKNGLKGDIRGLIGLKDWPDDHFRRPNS